MQLQFKPCTKADIPVLQAVGSQSYREHYLHIWATNKEFYINLSFSKESLSRDFDNKNLQYFLIAVDGTPAGLIKLNLHHAFKEIPSNKALEIEKIYILKVFAQNGLGKVSLAFIENYAKELGKSMLWLKVMASSPALRFYAACGYRVGNCFKIWYEDLHNDYRDMFSMYKKLTV